MKPERAIVVALTFTLTLLAARGFAQAPAHVTGDAAAAEASATLTLEGHNGADPAEAVTTLTAAAANGSPQAALALANAYFEGRTVAGDPVAAREWWRRAAELGAVDAQFNLGLVLLRDGENTEEALAWLERAAAADHVLACFAAGTWYAARDDEAARAERHLNCAARRGYAPAQYNLARWHLDRQRPDLARTWFEAAAVTFEPAARALESVPARAPVPIAAPAVSPAPAASPPSPGEIRGVDWVNAQPDTYYTLQVAASRTGAALKRLLSRHARGGESAYFLHRPRAREPFSAVVGSYADYAAAERGLADLSPALVANAPWIRRFGILQRELERAERTDDEERQAAAPNAAE
jgi:TPR repeat protein